MAWASSSESSLHSHSTSAMSNLDKNPFLPAVFVGSEQNVMEGASPRHRPHVFRHQASTSSGEFLEQISPGPSPSASAPWPQEIDAVELQQLDVIGSGGCGLVFKGRWGNKLVAIKQINQGTLQSSGAGPAGGACPMATDAWIQRFFNEAQTIWRARDHPHVVQLLGVCLQRYWLVFEFCAGGGLDFVIARCRLAPAVIVEWATQIASGMEYLHSVGIIHRDLKSCNILLKYQLPQLQLADTISEESWSGLELNQNASFNNLSEDQQSQGGANQNDSYPPVILKIADFGLARQLSLDKSRVIAKYAEGTVRYLAPEVVTGQTYSKASDVWSYGVVFWELLTGEQPYRDVEECAVMFRVGRQRRSLLPVPPSCPPAFASLLNDCWSSDPFNRPSFTAIVDRLSLSDLRVAEFTRTGTEFSSLQDSWRQIIENSFNELRVRQEELELADLALRERAAQQQIIDDRLRQWERQLAQRELRVVERELSTLFLDDQEWRRGAQPNYATYDRRQRRSSDSRFSLSSLLSPRLQASKIRPPHRVSLSHLRRDRNLISRPLVSSVQVSHVVAPSPVMAHRDPTAARVLPSVITTGVVDGEPSVVRRLSGRRIHAGSGVSQASATHSPTPSRSWIHVPESLSAPSSPSSRRIHKAPPSRVRQALVGASRLLAAVLIGHDPAGPRPPSIPLISTSEQPAQDAPALFSSGPVIDYETGSGVSVTSPVLITPTPVAANPHLYINSPVSPLYYIGEGYRKPVALSTPTSPKLNSSRPEKPIGQAKVNFQLDQPQSAVNFISFDDQSNAGAKAAVTGSRPGSLPFSPQTIENEASAAGESAVPNAAQSTDSGMAMSSMSLGSVSGASGSQTSATTPLDSNSESLRLFSISTVNDAFFKMAIKSSPNSGRLSGPSAGRVGQHAINMSRYRQHRQSLSTDLEDQRSTRNKYHSSPGPPESVVSEPGGTVTSSPPEHQANGQ